MKLRSLLCAYAMLCLPFAGTALGALSKEHTEFGNGATQLLLTKAEKKQWSAIKTDEQAKAFIELFWARRDPTPETPANEYRDAINGRMKLADSLYETAKLPGRATDQGKVFVLMGKPTELRRTDMQTSVRTPGGTLRQAGLNETSAQGAAPTEVWRYEQSRSDLKLGQPIVQVVFTDQYASNNWKMERSQGTDYAAVFDRVAGSYILSPNLTAPAFNAAATNANPTPLKSDALRTAIDEARAAKATSDTLFLNYGEFITPEGEYYVPVQLYAPKAAGLGADATVTFFGAIENADGTGRVAEIEENVKLTASGDALMHARSFAVPPGSYVATFGLAKDGKPISIVSKSMTLKGLDKSAPMISSLMLSNNVYALPQAQNPTDPFAFGGIKIVPKGDSTFRSADELWCFFELANPGLDTTTGQPKMTMQIGLTGTTNDRLLVNQSAPESSIDPQALKGVAGHYVLTQGIPLASFKPGKYAISVKVTDRILGKTYDFREEFRVVE